MARIARVEPFSYAQMTGPLGPMQGPFSDTICRTAASQSILDSEGCNCNAWKTRSRVPIHAPTPRGNRAG